MTEADGGPDLDAGPGRRWDVALSFVGAQGLRRRVLSFSNTRTGG